MNYKINFAFNSTLQYTLENILSASLKVNVGIIPASTAFGLHLETLGDEVR